MAYPIADSERARREELSAALGQPFQLESLVGTGGQAEVWRARDVELGRPVAIKILRADAVDRREFAERLRREAVSIARIQSPHVVPILQFISHHHVCCLVMPLVEGETLASALARGALPLGDAIRIIRETALGLADAHDVGVVHRDVKPSNILLDGKTGSARLTDFGIAKALGESEPGLTATGAFVGTAAYMSPEQFDTSTTVGTASDVYSLGVVAFEAVAGELPFRGTIAQLALQHTNDPAPSLATIDGVNPSLVQLVDRCLSKDPIERPAARDVAASLETIDSANNETEAPITGSRRMRLLRFVGLLLATLALSVFAIVVKGEALIMLKALLKTLLKTALHLL